MEKLGASRLPETAAMPDVMARSDMAAPLTSRLFEPIKSCAICAPSDIIIAPNA
jgi:hypothetical protein